ncbi:hypothetical protein V6N13_149591 [Hibiscus sabdariffa]|uniref:Uncharacterized protein n=2 Tax=Hibiscus sabdariffa TaxID=183260 RepID=A0ABR2EGX0_9ROSI
MAENGVVVHARSGAAFATRMGADRDILKDPKELDFGESGRTARCANDRNPDFQLIEMPSINGVEGECSRYAVA